MNESDHDIDILLRRNVERQLEGFDWERLGQGIGSRLASADTPSRSWSRYGRWGAMAAAAVLTAGVLILAVISATGPGPEAGGSVVGEAKVAMIETAHATGTARVSFSPAERPVRSEVKILVSDKPRQPDRARASWCIIVGQESSVESHRNGRDASDVLYLF